MSKKLTILIISTCLLVIAGVLIYLFLPVQCPKGVKIDEEKTESVDTVLVLDGSSSMDDKTNAGDGEEMTKYEAAFIAAGEIVTMIEEAKDTQKLKNRIGYVEFSGSVGKSIKLSDSFAEINKYLEKREKAAGWGTNMSSGIDKALQLFKDSDSKNKTMVILSDGRNNQGLTNDEILSDQISEAKEKGIRVYTIGFDIDESKKTSVSEGVDPIFLYQIAKESDGKYYYAQSLLDLVFAFSDLYHQSTGTSIASIKGSIKTGEYKSAKINIPCNCGGLRVTLNSSKKDDVKVNIINPLGGRVGESLSRLKTVKNDGFLNLTYKNPMSGEWQVEVKGEDVKSSEGEFYLSASVSSKKSSSESFNDWVNDKLWYLVSVGGLLLISVFTFVLYKVSNKNN